MARRKRPLSRQKKTAAMLAALGVAGGVAAYFLFIRRKTINSTLTSSGLAVKRVPVGAVHDDAYTPGTDANLALTAAQNGWYAQHPDEPFVNDDGSCNILPEFDNGDDIPGCLNQSPPSD